MEKKQSAKETLGLILNKCEYDKNYIIQIKRKKPSLVYCKGLCLNPRIQSLYLYVLHETRDTLFSM